MDGGAGIWGGRLNGKSHEDVGIWLAEFMVKCRRSYWKCTRSRKVNPLSTSRESARDGAILSKRYAQGLCDSTVGVTDAVRASTELRHRTSLGHTDLECGEHVVVRSEIASTALSKVTGD